MGILQTLWHSDSVPKDFLKKKMSAEDIETMENYPVCKE